MGLERLRRLHPATRNLLMARFVRSVGQGALLVGFALYLARLGWSGGRIGLLLGTAGLGGGLLGLAVGLTSDRWGRRRFLLVFQAVLALVSVLLVVTANPEVIFLATLIGGFGRGRAGSAGPFAPAEGAWLAEVVQPDRRGLVFSVNASLGFFGMAGGALLAGLVPVLQHWWPGPAAYRGLFALSAIGALVVLGILWVTPGGGGHPPASDAARGPGVDPTVRHDENRALRWLVLINVFNGVSIGLTAPLIAYWFNCAFGVGVGSLGPVFGATFLLTGMASIATGVLTRGVGIVRSVVVGRSAGLLLLVALPLMPAYSLAAVVYVVRSAVSRGTVGARQAMALSLVGDARRGWATSLNAVSTILPATAGPVIAGYLLDSHHLALPFFIAAVMQLVYLVLYALVFRHYEPGRPTARAS